MEMAYDVTDQDKAATVPKVEAACAAAVSLVIATKVKTTIAVSISISIAIMFAVVVTGEVAVMTPKSPSSSLQCKVSMAYVVNNDDGSISVIATDKSRVVATIPVGAGPSAVAVTPDGTRAYVTNSDSRTVSVIDTVANSVLTTFSLVNTFGLRAVAISPDGTRVYVSHLLNTPQIGVLSTIDTVTNQVMFTIPVDTSYDIFQDMVVHPDGTRAYFADFRFGLTVVDIVKQMVINRLYLGPVFGIAITPDGTQIYLTPNPTVYDDITGAIVVNTTTNRFKTFIEIPSNYSVQSFAVAVSPDGKRAYLASFHPKIIVTVIDTATDLVLEYIPIPITTLGISAIAVSVDGTQVYATDGVHNVFVIDAVTNKVMENPILVGSRPIAIATAWIPC
jgi:YVTN family beta-propeller protein